MNNSLFTQIFTRLKPTKYLTNLARLKHILKHLKSLSALILATLLVACAAGGGGSSADSPATKVANFNVVPYADRMELSWTNPARADIAFINISWDAYATTDLSRNTAGDGYLIISNSTQTAASVSNEYNITTDGQSDVGKIADGFELVGAKLTLGNAYIFSSQLYFKAAGNSTTAAAPKSPDIPAPQVPRELGENSEGDSFANDQVYRVGNPSANPDDGNVTLSWTNPQVGAGNIASVLITYQSNRSSNNKDEITLRAPASSAQLLSGSSVSYIWTGLEPGDYDFTIQPILGDIFFGVEVVPAMLNGVTVPELSDTSPTAVAVSPTTTVMANSVAAYTDGITITTTITDGDPDDGVRPTLGYATSPVDSCTISDETLSVYDGSGVATATAKVNLLNAGTTCVVTATPNEDGDDGSSATFRIAQEHIAPLLAVRDAAGGSAGAAVTFTVTATKQDAGTTTAVTFAATFTADGCTVTRMDPTTTGNSGYASVGDTYDQVYSATFAGSGNCAIPKSSFTVTEDGELSNGGTGNIAITFSDSMTPPTAVAVSPATTVMANTVAEYTDGIIITTTITDGDPDDGVRPTLGYTTSPVDSCTISDETLSVYDGSGVATATAKVNLLSAGTTCVVTATPNEAVGGTPATFTIDQEHIAPLLAVPSDATGLEGTAVNFTVTATKQDAGAIASVTFADTFTTDGCTVTRMDPAMTGNSVYESVGDTYTQVYSTTRAGSANCTIPKSSFTVTEDAAVADGGTGNIIISFIAVDFDGDGLFGDADNCPNTFNPGQSNLDQDGEGDVCDTDSNHDNDAFMDADDVDADGDGLIELRTAAQLDMVRNNLFGTGLDANNSDGDVNAGGNVMGCGGGDYANGTVITTCSGYELVADIDLAAAGYDNWDPIGRQASAFRTIFEGNGFKIRNLKIQLDTQINFRGFFSSITDATIRNVHVRDVNITMTIDNTLDNNPVAIGGLVGLMTGSLIINSSAAGPLVAGTSLVGGLVGSSNGGQIVSSYAEFGEVNATHGSVGGLVGSTNNIDIKLSYAVTGKVAGQTLDNGAGRLGGLIGAAGGNSGSLSSSLAITANFTGIRLLSSGGLAGLSRASSNIFLAAITNNIDIPINTIAATGERGGGSGFIGRLLRSTNQIRSSYAVTNHASIGEFVASIANGATVSESYWDNTTLTPPDTRTLTSNAVGKPTTDLQGTTDFTGIYETWGNGWCDAATNEFITDSSSPLATIPDADANRFWDLGTATEYPAMNCLPNFTPAEQRAAMAKALNGESPVRDLQ